jgi:hypothetical protein
VCWCMCLSVKERIVGSRVGEGGCPNKKWFTKLKKGNHFPKIVKGFWSNGNHFQFDHYFTAK